MHRNEFAVSLSRRTVSWTGVGIAALLVSACASAPQEPQAPQPDANAVRIMERVTAQPSAVFGGGMVYELFVGQRFNARLDQRAGEFILTDLGNERACHYSTEGILQAPAGSEKGLQQYCADLAVNAYQYLASE